MSFLDRLDETYGRYIPEGVTKVLVGGQVLSYFLVYSHPEYASLFYLNGRQLFQGQVWKLLTVLFTPISGSILLSVLAWYFFYIVGTALEKYWGPFRYVVYIGIAYIALVVFAIVVPSVFVSSISLYTSLFLAYAYIYPQLRVLLFFIIPVKVTWLGFLAWVGLGVSFLFGTSEVKILTLLSVVNFFVFFGSDMPFILRNLFKRFLVGVGKPLVKKTPHHICCVCGKNEIDDPYMEIRYCSQCIPNSCYCGDHIVHHQHKRLVN